MSTITQIEDLIKSSSNDLEALQGILDGVKDSMEDLRKEYESGKKDVNEYNAAMLKLQRVYDQVIDAQKNLQKEQKKADDALEKQHKKFKDVETSARRYGATLNTALSTISSMIRETNPLLANSLGSVQKLIPNLVDCLGQFQKLTKSAKAAGVEITTFGKLMKIATSPSGVLLLITAVVELVSALRTANKEADQMATKYNELEAQRQNLLSEMKSAQTEATNLTILSEAYQELVRHSQGGTPSEAQFSQFLSTWATQLDAVGLSIKTTEDAEEVFVKNTEAYRQATAIRSKAAKEEADYFDKVNKAREEYGKAQDKLSAELSKYGLYYKPEDSTIRRSDTKQVYTESIETTNWYAQEAARPVQNLVSEFRAAEKAYKDFLASTGNTVTGLKSTWSGYYEYVGNLKVKKGGKEEGKKEETSLLPGVNIDWNEYNRLLDEARETIMWDIDNQIDLLDAETERAQRALLQKKKEEFNAFWDEYTKNATYKIKQGIWNEDYLGGVDNTEVDELDPYADVLLPKITDAEQAMYDARLENYSNFLSSYADLTDSISGMISDNLDAELEAGKISEAEYKRRTKVLQAFQISSIVANTASGIVDVWKAYATERIGNAEAAVATGPAAPATLAALNAKSLTSAILQTATLSAAGVAGIASVRSGNLSGTSVTPSAGISSTPTITYTQNQGSNQDVVDAVNQVAINTAQQQVVLVVDDLNKVQSNATKVSVQSSF